MYSGLLCTESILFLTIEEYLSTFSVVRNWMELSPVVWLLVSFYTI